MKKSFLPMNLQYFAEGDGDEPKFSFDDFKAFAESNDDAQKFLQSQAQSAADKQLEAWQKNNLDKIKQDTIKEHEDAKKNKTPEQIELEKLKSDFEAEKALRVTSDNKAFVAEKVANLEIDGDVKETVAQFMLTNLVSADTEFTKKAVEAFTDVLSTIQEKHAEELKNYEMKQAFGGKNTSKNESGGEPQKTDDPMQALGQALSQLNI